MKMIVNSIMRTNRRTLDSKKVLIESIFKNSSNNINHKTQSNVFEFKKFSSNTNNNNNNNNNNNINSNDRNSLRDRDEINRSSLVFGRRSGLIGKNRSVENRSKFNSIRSFGSTSNVEFLKTLKNLDRHPRARRLKIFTNEPIVPSFPKQSNPSIPSSSSTTLVSESNQKNEELISLRNYVEPKKINIPNQEEPLIDYMTGLLMRKGKRNIASKHIITLLNQLRLVTGQEPFGLLSRAINLASPLVLTRNETKRIKVTTVPVPLNEVQRARRGILWIVKQSEKRPGKKFGERLAMEVIAVLNGNSEVLKLKAEQHRLAFVNRANLRTRPSRA